MNICQCSAIRMNNDEITEINDDVCVEESFRLYLNDEFLVELIASPGQPEELGIGYIVCEGLASDVSDVHASGDEIYVYAETSGKIEKELRSSGGVGIKRSPGKVSSSLIIKRKDVFDIMDAIKSEIWDKTGGTHCSVLFSDNKLVAKSVDIGRHNTVDKVVGSAVLNNIDLSTCVLGCTGRQPGGMVSKASNAGIPIVISKAASTDKGIVTADETGVTLICFVRDNRFTVYTHPHRIC